jgi:hypothetical protein
MANKRKSVGADGRPKVIRLSVPVDPHTHAKLLAIAALRGVERSELAAGFVRAGLRGVIVQDVKGGGTDGSEDGAGGQ